MPLFACNLKDLDGFRWSSGDLNGFREVLIEVETRCCCSLSTFELDAGLASAFQDLSALKRLLFHAISGRFCVDFRSILGSEVPTLRAFSSPSESAPTLSSGWSRTPRSMISAMCFRAGPYLRAQRPGISRPIPSSFIENDRNSMKIRCFSIGLGVTTPDSSSLPPFHLQAPTSSIIIFRLLLSAVVAERHVVGEARLIARGRQGVAEELLRLAVALLLPQQRAFEDLP